MDKDVIIFLVCIAFILLVTAVGVVVTIFYFKMIKRQQLIRYRFSTLNLLLLNFIAYKVCKVTNN